MTAAGAGLGLVPFVKTYYREMLQQHIRLKQQLIVQLQNQKAKQRRKKKNARGRKRSPFLETQKHQHQITQQTRERSLKRTQDYALTMGTSLSSFYSPVAVHHSPAAAMRRFWAKLVGASSSSESSLHLHSGGKTEMSIEEEEKRNADEQKNKYKKHRRAVFKSKYAGTDYKSMTETSSFLRYVALSGVAGFCRFWSRVLMRSCEVQGEEIMHEAILKRERNRALITVSNHTASIDDPFVTSLLVPDEALQPSSFTTRSSHSPSDESENVKEVGDVDGDGDRDGDAVHLNRIRWVMCATDRCFKSKLTSEFFKAVQALPVERGAGLHQESMKVATTLLHKGGWVHIFPEGTRSNTGKLLPMKPGVGQLVVNTIDAQTDLSNTNMNVNECLNGSVGSPSPLIVPYYHEGMGDLMPKGKSIPQVGTDVKVVVGEPIEIEDLVAKYQTGQITDKEMRKHVVKRVEVALHQLQRKSTQEDYELTYNDTNTYETSHSNNTRDLSSNGMNSSSLDLETITFEALGMWTKVHPMSVRSILENGYNRLKGYEPMEEENGVLDLDLDLDRTHKMPETQPWWIRYKTLLLKQPVACTSTGSSIQLSV